jgi:hypothetical protein
MKIQNSHDISGTEQITNLNSILELENLESVVRVGNSLICAGTVPMIIPQGGAHVRQAEIRLPKFAQDPTVTATLYSTDSPGSVFGIFSIKINHLLNQTQVAITATNAERGVAIPSSYLCDFIIIGKID